MEMAFDQHNSFILSRSTTANQVEEMEIAAKFFGRDSIMPLTERVAIQHKNEFTYYSLKVNDHVVGYTAIHRLPPKLLKETNLYKNLDFRKWKENHL